MQEIKPKINKKIKVEEQYSKYKLQDDKGNVIQAKVSKEKITIKPLRRGGFGAGERFIFVLSKKETARRIIELMLEATKL